MHSKSEAARMLGIHRHAVAAAVTLLGIETHPMPLNGRAEGIASRDVVRIAKGLGIPVPKQLRRGRQLAG
jgi:hypothetical protein